MTQPRGDELHRSAVVFDGLVVTKWDRHQFARMQNASRWPHAIPVETLHATARPDRLRFALPFTDADYVREASLHLNDRSIPLEWFAPKDNRHDGSRIMDFAIPNCPFFALRGWTVTMADNAAYPGESACPFSFTCTHFGNRIARGHFTLNGVPYTLAINNGVNSLHGGSEGFDKVVWTVAKANVTPEGPQLTLTYLSRDGEEGYPGNLTVTAVYTLTEANALRLDYSATTDKNTVINLTQHSYFNLLGHGDVLRHVVQIKADRFTPVDSTLIPTGELRPVVGTPFDFRQPTAIGARINEPDEQLQFAKGYDHNWVIDKTSSALAVQATVYEPETGRVLEVSSTEPGLQFYSGNFLDGTLTGKGGWVYGLRNAFTVEPQHFPDSPNHANFPSTVLKPGQFYHNTIQYRFTARCIQAGAYFH
jgi:aldose 1-epimerase